MFQQALEECLQALQRGESLEACLARHARYADDLRPLLETAAGLRKAGRVAPSAAAQEAGRQLFVQRAQALGRRRAPGRWPLRGAAVAASLLLAITLMGGATVLAASKSLPDDPLYPVKLTVERARLQLAFSDEARASILLNRAETRLDEMEHIAARGKPIGGSVVLALEGHTDRAAAILEKEPPPPELKARAEAVWGRQAQVLARLFERTAPEDRSEMVRAVWAAHQGRLQLRGRSLPATMGPGGMRALPPGTAAILRLQGPVRSRGPGVWAVGERDIQVGEETIVDGEGPQEGRPVVVIAIRFPDGQLKALIVGIPVDIPSPLPPRR